LSSLYAPTVKLVLLLYLSILYLARIEKMASAGAFGTVLNNELGSFI